MIRGVVGRAFYFFDFDFDWKKLSLAFLLPC